MTGVNAEVKTGPRCLIHHDIPTVHIPCATTPYKYTYTQFINVKMILNPKLKSRLNLEHMKHRIFLLLKMWPTVIKIVVKIFNPKLGRITKLYIHTYRWQFVYTWMYRYNDSDDGESVFEDPFFHISSLDQAKKGALKRTESR